VIAVDATDFEEALTRLRAEPAERLGAERPAFRPVQRIGRRFSDLLLVRVDAPARSFDLFVKRAKVDERLDTRALVRQNLRREFDSLCRVHATLGQEPGLQAARPVACYPDLEILVTERVRGLTLGQLLHRRAVWWGGTRGDQQMEWIAEGVGRWLRRYQALDSNSAPISIRDLRKYLDDRLRKLTARRWLRISARQRAALLDYFDARAGRLPASEVVQSRAHGDLNAENIIVGRHNEVGVVDFSMARPQPRLLDVTHLHMSLDVLRSRPWYRPATLVRMMSALVKHYDPNLSPSEPMFEIMALQHGVARMVGLEDALTPGSAALRSWVLRRVSPSRRLLFPAGALSR
jgi:hypothetical protein